MRAGANAKFAADTPKGVETRSLPTRTHCFPRNFTLITRTARVLAPATLAALPSTRAIPDRDVFYVAYPIDSIREQAAATATARSCIVASSAAQASLRRAKSGLR
jgi:hypothetical protein